MATYIVTAEGDWPANAPPHEPYVGEMFGVTRDGESVRSVLATDHLASLIGLEGDLRRRGYSENKAKTRARDAFRQLGAEEARRYVTARNLKYRDDDTPLNVPVELGSPKARSLAMAQDLRHYEPGGQVGDAFEVED